MTSTRPRCRKYVLHGSYGTVKVDRGSASAFKYTQLFEHSDQEGQEGHRYLLACNVREAAYVQHLTRHPLEGVVRCFGCTITNDGSLISKMEMGDITLHDYATSHSYEERAAAFDDIFRQVTIGIVNMHDDGVVHGDIKTNNILRVSQDPLVFKLIDFGGVSWTSHCARHVSLCTYVTRAPELFVEGALSTPKSDAWSLGATMLNFLSRKFLVDDSAKDEDVMEHIKKQFDAGVRIRIPSNLHDDARDMLQHLLQVDPALRWSCHDVLHRYFRFFDVPVPRPRALPTYVLPPVRGRERFRNIVRSMYVAAEERDELKCVPLGVEYVRRYVDNDFCALDDVSAGDIVTAAYVLARAVALDEDTKVVKLTSRVRDVIVAMLRKFELNVVSRALVFRPRLISVDGNIGASKSTVVAAISKALSVDTWTEPVAEWSELLQRYYCDPARWGALLHAQILLSYAGAERARDATTVCERSAWSCLHVFQSMLHEDGLATDAENAVVWKLGRCVGGVPDVILYLRCDVDTCIIRQVSRGRECEKGLDRTYMQRLHAQYEKVLTRENCAQQGIRLLEIDATGTREEVCARAIAAVGDLLYCSDDAIA